MFRTLAPILVAVTLGACSKRPDPPPAAAQPPARAAAPTPAAPPAAPADLSDPDDAYFVSDNKSLWRVHAGKVTPVSFSAPCSRIRGIYQPKANAAWIDCDYDGFFVLFGSRALAAPRPVSTASSTLVLGGDGSLWSAPYKATSLYRLEGATWKAEALPDELRGAEHLSFTVDAKGRVYLADTNNGWLREGGAWRPMPLPADKLRRFPPHFVATEDGTVFMMVGYRWTEFTDGKVGRRSYHNYEDPVPRVGGGVVIGNEQRVSVIAADGKVERSVSFARGAVGRRASGEGQSVAVDGRGRIWVATQYGLVVIDERDAVEQWEPGRIEGFDGTDVTLVVVGGKGPELPALGPRVRGEVVGRVVGVKPGATLEMCTGSTGFSTGIGPGTFYGRTPCDRNPFRFRAKLDAEGRFRFTGVPPLPMSAVVQLSSRDWTRRKAGCCSRLRPGTPLELEL